MLARVRHGDDYVAIGRRDLHLAQPCFRIAGMNAGADVELEAVPRADHVQLRLREEHALAGAVSGDLLLDLGNHLALTRGPAHVRAMIEVGEELAAELEYGDLEPFEANDLSAGIRELRHRTDIHLTHRTPLTSLSFHPVEPHRHVPEIETRRLDQIAHGHDDVG